MPRWTIFIRGRRCAARNAFVTLKKNDRSKTPGELAHGGLERNRRSGEFTSHDSTQPLLHDEMFADHLAADQMLLNNPFQYGRVTAGVPGSFGVYDCHGATETDSETVGLRAKHAPAPTQAQFTQTLFEVIPGEERPFTFAALGLGLIATEKNVTLRLENA